MTRLRVSAVAVLAVLVLPVGARAQASAVQSTETQLFTLDEALRYAVDHYPTIKAAVEQVNVVDRGRQRRQSRVPPAP